MLDPSGAPVPAAELEARNVATDLRRTARTEADGEFTIPNLPPGMYELQVKKEGFRELVETGIELQADQTARLDLKLQVGAIARISTCATLSP